MNWHSLNFREHNRAIHLTAEGRLLERMASGTCNRSGVEKEDDRNKVQRFEEHASHFRRVASRPFERQAAAIPAGPQVARREQR